MSLLMARTKVLDKQGKVLGIVTDNNKFISKKDIQNFAFSNVKITKDSRILGEIGTGILGIDILNLYHGSYSGIVGKIGPKSRQTCDFGAGFYTGDTIQQPLMLVSESENSILYDLLADITGLRVYTFNSDILWALYIGCNRGMINGGEYKKLVQLVKSINNNDVVIGNIADDRMAHVFGLLISGAISSDALTNALKHIKLGKQFVFKTQKACDRVLIKSSRVLENDERKKYKSERHRIANDARASTDKILAEYSKGKRVYEILNQFK